ncbi:MAG TPA: thioredoxin domain-containing protein [Candidatus Limnocylindrales bacterium]|nr:thioredoxin domain-containing protein [Candidatus Limnocylindrales bacterium]
MLQRTLAPLAMALLLPIAAMAEEIVATVGDQNITRSELEKSVKAELMKNEQERYEILEQGLDNMVSDKLLEMEAKTRGTTVEALKQELMSAEVPEPTAEQIQALYDQAKEQLGGQTLDQVKPRIIEYLKGQERAKKAQALLAELRTKHPTAIKLAPPTVEVSDAGREAKGPANAKVTIIAFSDYECPFCKRADETVHQVLKEYEGKIRYVHRDYPLPFHKNARKAAMAARCAGDQGKFWEFNEALFKATDISEPKLGEIATTLTLDKAKFDECLASDKYKTMIDEDVEAAGEAGVSGTPAFFINGRMLSGAQPLERFKALIDAELQKS